MKFIKRYYHWLHGQWPAGHVENLPELDENSRSNIPGLYVVGDLKGIPLLKFSIDSGARAVQTIAADPNFVSTKSSDNKSVIDIAIIGAGLAGVSAATEASKRGLSYVVIEGSQPFSTIVNFPKGKPIYTYPKDMDPAGDIKVTATVKETLLDELHKQIDGKINIKTAFCEQVKKKESNFEITLRDQPSLLARRVIVAIGRSGNFRKLGVPGEQLDKVYNRLHDPKDYAGKNCLVVGGGDSAMETAIALTQAGAFVTLSYRKPQFARAKPENIEMVQALAKNPAADVQVTEPVSERVTTASGDYMGAKSGLGRLTLLMGSSVKLIAEGAVILQTAGGQEKTIENHVVFTMIGREAPLSFFRKSGVHISGEWTRGRMLSLLGVLASAIFIYHWKKTGIGGFEHIPVLRQMATIGETFSRHGWFPYRVGSHWMNDNSALGKTLAVSLSEPGFYYSLVYCLLILYFGQRRILRRKTPYVRLQTWTLTFVQIIPLFLLPYLILPWLGHSGFFDAGIMEKVADALFPKANYGHGREYWRAFGFILAWPLFFWNVFTSQPMWTWLAISFFQTFVIIPGIIYFWGKGAYCGWICSCGALAETLGDAHRTKMPHGPKWNKLNMAGQVILALAFLLLAFRILGWAHVGWAEKSYAYLFHDMPVFNYAWFVDLFLAGIIGVGLYFHFSGRVWCRFFCPLASLMHIYARFSRFRIFAEKKKCISCNVCTFVCHQGIDIMNFANKGVPMSDPECVRCSACVQSCPTGVLSFGQADNRGVPIKFDALTASSFPSSHSSAAK